SLSQLALLSQDIAQTDMRPGGIRVLSFRLFQGSPGGGGAAQASLSQGLPDFGLDHGGVQGVGFLVGFQRLFPGSLARLSPAEIEIRRSAIGIEFDCSAFFLDLAVKITSGAQDHAKISVGDAFVWISLNSRLQGLTGQLESTVFEIDCRFVNLLRYG